MHIGMMIQWTVFMMVLSLFSCQANTLMDTTTTDSWTVTYDGRGVECLPYDDGSVVPDCSKYFGTLLKQPYYAEHAYSE